MKPKCLWSVLLTNSSKFAPTNQKRDQELKTLGTMESMGIKTDDLIKSI